MPDVTSDVLEVEEDISSLSDRALHEQAYRQSAEMLLALGDVLFAVGALQKTMDEVLKAARGEDQKGEGTSVKDEVEAFKAAITDLAGAVRKVPEETADKVNEGLEATLARVVGA